MNEISRPKLIVVEGKDEELLLGEFCRCLSLTDIQVLPGGGKFNIGSVLNAVRLYPGFEKVNMMGVIRDADDNPSNALVSVQNALSRAGFDVPKGPMEPAGTKPEVRILILPGGDRTGALEDLCLQSIADLPEAVCINAFFDCLRSKPPQKEIAKAKVAAFLASRPDPCKRVGEAAQAGYWNFDHAAFAELRRLLLFFAD